MSIYEALGGPNGHFPKLIPATSTSTQMLGVGPIPGPTLTMQQPGWRFATQDGGWTVTILDDSFSLETIQYTTWEGDEGFASLLRQVVMAIAERLRPAVEARLGLRYVNQITYPSVKETVEWRGLIDDRILGAIAHDRLGPGVLASDTRVSLDLDGEAGCILRYGSFLDAARPGYATFLIDTDCYREAGLPFDSESLLEQADLLNTSALGIFQQITTADLRDQIAQRPEETA